MTLNRPWQIWLSFTLCLAVVLAAMGWVSWTALRLDRADARAQQQAALEEAVRLALWRMDSALAPLIARESTRPYFAYSAFYPAERAYTRMFAEIEQGEVLVPSPLLTQESKHILLHFQIGPDGEINSPQVPTGNMRDLAETGYASHERINASAELLAELRSLVSRDKLLALLPTETPPRPTPGPRARVAVLNRRGGKDAQAEQQASNIAEAQARAQTYQKAAQPQQKGRQPQPPAATPDAPAPDVAEGVIHPIWFDSALLLVRRVSVTGTEYVQGCRLDWPGIRETLLEEIADLLPRAGIEPIHAGSTARPTRRLAALPVALIPGEIPIAAARGITPIAISLIVAWACVLLAAGAVGALLLGAVSLSERRGAFVSAVTHELRTPLTTFQMYTEMLAEKMVPAEKRRQYLNTLRIEADRLSHLVENVLSYARLERSRGRSRVESVSLATVRDRVRERLAERAKQAGMCLVVEDGDAWDAVRVRADLSAVEQILFNLVDNACKYAAGAEDRRIHLQAQRAGRFAALRIGDHGPGISARDARRLFRPFSKSSREAADSAPGVGLGLALCRRLARDMGGTLRLDDGGASGACFILALPAV